MKIHIIGGPGSGKTFLADKLSRQLGIPRYRYRTRILRRFFRRKLGLEKGKKESLRSLTALLRWADKYQNVQLPEIRKLLLPYSFKVQSD